jgi:hypothetical protein
MTFSNLVMRWNLREAKPQHGVIARSAQATSKKVQPVKLERNTFNINDLLSIFDVLSSPKRPGGSSPSAFVAF